MKEKLCDFFVGITEMIRQIAKLLLSFRAYKIEAAQALNSKICPDGDVFCKERDVDFLVSLSFD